MIGLDRLTPHQEVTGRQPACWGVDPEVFFGPADSPAGGPLHVWERHALAVCAGCPVVRACLAEALEFPAAEQYGVVGGMTAGQRRAVMRTSRRGRGRVRRPRTGGRKGNCRYTDPCGDRRQGHVAWFCDCSSPPRLANGESRAGAVTYPTSDSMPSAADLCQ